MKRTLLSILLLSSFNMVISQEDTDVKNQAAKGTGVKDANYQGWKKGGFFASNLSLTTFSNWAGGGVNNTAFFANSSLFANYAKGKNVWENYLDMFYGVVRNGANKIEVKNANGEVIDSRPNPFIKNDDRLIFTSKYGRKINTKLNYSTLFSLNTQMFPGFAATDIFAEKQHVSNFMAQAFGYLSVGIDYKPTQELSIYFSPITAKYTVVREQRLADLGSFGVRAAEYDTLGNKIRPGETFRRELGWYANIFYKKDIAKNINLQSRLELFNNYRTIGIIDVNWQNQLVMKVNKYITISIINQILYDQDVDVIPTDPTKPGTDIVNPKVQMKNFFGVGFSALFGDKL